MRKVLYLLGILNDADIDWMARAGQVMRAPAGKVLIEQGVQTQWLYVLLEGRLRVLLKGGVEIVRLGPGEVLGEISFLDSRPPSASVDAVEDSYLLALHRDLIEAKMASDTGFAARFYHSVGAFLADRLRSTSGQLGYLQKNAVAAELPMEDPAQELDDKWTENISFAASRFDNLLRALEIA